MSTHQALTEFKRFLQDTDRSPNTVSGYLEDLKDFTQWFENTNGEVFTPMALTPSDVRAYRQHLLNERKLKPNTINRRLASLAAFARWARAIGQIESDPTTRIQSVEQVPPGPRWLDRKQRFALQRVIEQEQQMAEAQPDQRRSLWRGRDAALMTLLLHTGLRVSEAAGLDVNAVELKPRSGKVTVQGKGTKVRSVPLNAEARAALERWLSARPECETPALFVSQMLKRMTPRTIERIVTEYGHKAKVDGLTPHVLRHTFAKTLIDRGVPIDQVATLLGHASLNTTRIYTLPSEQDLQKAVEALMET